MIFDGDGGLDHTKRAFRKVRGKLPARAASHNCVNDFLSLSTR
jgi:hypothetical protein